MSTRKFSEIHTVDMNATMAFSRRLTLSAPLESKAHHEVAKETHGRIQEEQHDPA